MDVERIRTIAAVALGFAFILIGVDHFLRTAWYVPIVPEVLGFPEFWVYLSGVAEVGFGGLLMVPRYRRLAAMSGVAMLVVLYWANLNMWVNDIPLNGVRYGTGWHLGRMMAQTLLIGLVGWVGGLHFPHFQREGEP